MKIKTVILIDFDLLKWIELEMKNNRFGNQSHGFNYYVKIIKERKLF